MNKLMYKCKICGTCEFSQLLTDPPRYVCDKCKIVGKSMSHIATLINTVSLDNLKKCRFCQHFTIKKGSLYCEEKLEYLSAEDIFFEDYPCKYSELTDELKEVIR